MRIRWRLPTAFVLGTLVFAGVVALTSALILRDVFLERLEDEMSRQAHQFAVVLADSASLALAANTQEPAQEERPPLYPALQQFTQRLGQAAGARFTLINKNGWVLADSEASPETLENHSTRPEVKLALAGYEARERRYSTTLKQNEVYVALPLPRTPSPWSEGVLRIAQPSARIDSMLSAAWRIPLLVWAILLLPMVIATYFTTRSLTEPLERLRQMTAKVASGDLTHRTSIHRNDELGELAEALNSMAAQLETRERELKAETERSGQVLSAMTEGVIVLDEEGRLVRANPAAERLLGVPLIGTEGRPLLLAARSFPAKALAAKAWREKRPVTDTVETVEGHVLVVETIPLGADLLVTGPHSAGVRTTDESDQGQTLFVFRDETARRNVERMRRDFVSNVSHELKTPLAGLSLLTQTLAGAIREDPGQAEKFAHRLKDEVERLNDLVHDLLTLARVEESQVPVVDKLDSVDLSALIGSVLSELRPAAEAKQHEILLRVSHELKVQGDQAGLYTLIRNLIDNAIRYTDPGGHIAVGLFTEQDKQGRSWAILEVTDDGIGIPLSEQKRIFERFYRIDKTRSRETGGTGLGLSIVRHVAERHGGYVKVHSTVGVGSTFRVWLPLEAPDESPDSD